MLEQNKQAKLKKNEINKYVEYLNDEQITKIWIRTLLSIQSVLPEIIKTVDSVIESNASSLSFITDIYNTEKSTYAQVEKVIDLSERKNKLLNIYLISKNLTGCLNEDDTIFVRRKFVSNWTSDELAEEYQISIRTVFRRTDKLLDKIYAYAISKKWSLQFILSQVKQESWIYDRFNKFVREYILSSKCTELEL